MIYTVVPARGSDPADEWLRLGVGAQETGQLPVAQQHYNNALRLNPRHTMALQNLAIVFAQSNLINEALLTIERAAIFEPNNNIIRTNWALLAFTAERYDEALKQATIAHQLDHNNVTRHTLATILTAIGRATEAIPLYEQILETEPTHSVASHNLCFIQSLTAATPADLLEKRQQWWKTNRYSGTIDPHYNDRSPTRSLRIGYVGGDFKSHSAAFIFSRVLFHHSKAVEMYLYSSLPVDPKADTRTQKFQELAGQRWRDISTMSDEEAALLIRKDKIDILVDLAGHTNGGRLQLFTRKPAPIQITAWGFAHGTGCPEIDYFFADPIVVPEEERQHYVEKIIDLPCVVTMEPTDYDLKGSSILPLYKNEYFTFGSYARYEKLSNECLQTFAEILRRVPDSKLQFKDNAYRRPYCVNRILEAMSDISPDRLLFSTSTSHQDHLLAYQQADLCLDPFWHCGGVVDVEMLYMGVPFITLRGTQPAGRTGTSLLTILNRTDWIANSQEEYIEKAVAWANKPKELSDTRKALRKQLLDSPIVANYVEKVEEAYRKVWIEWCNK